MIIIKVLISALEEQMQEILQSTEQKKKKFKGSRKKKKEELEGLVRVNIKIIGVAKRENRAGEGKVIIQ